MSTGSTSVAAQACLDGQLIGAEPVRLTDARTGEAHAAVVRVGDNDLDPAAAPTYAAGILAAAAVVDPPPTQTGRRDRLVPKYVSWPGAGRGQ